jgi:hypothetical protein
MSNDTAKFLVGRLELANIAAVLAVCFPEHLEFLIAVSNITFEFNVALSGVFSNPHYFPGGRSSLAFVVDPDANLNA